MRVNINRDKAGSMGVNVRDIAETLQYGLSGQRMGYFYMNGKQYEILGQINRQQRNQPANIKSIYIRNDKGQMIQMDNLVDSSRLLHRRNSITTTVSFQPPSLRDLPKERPSEKDLTKWTRLLQRYWMKHSVLLCPEIPRITGKVHPV